MASPASTFWVLPFCVGKSSVRSLLFTQAGLWPRLPDCHQNGPFLCFETGVFEDDPVALGSLGPQSRLPWDSTKQIPEQTEICSCKSRICYFSWQPDHLLLLTACPGGGKGRRTPLAVKLEGNKCSMCMSSHVYDKVLNKFIKSNYPLI